MIFAQFCLFPLMAISILSINVNGIHERPKRSKVFASLRAANCDIYLLQETHVSSASEGKQWESEWGGQAIFSPGTNRSAGVGLLVNPRARLEIANHRVDQNGRVVSAKIHQLDVPNSDFQILNIYAPNTVSDRRSFFDTFWQYTFRNVPLVLGGDFNCVPDVRRDKFGGDDTFGDKGITELHSFTGANSLIDIYRVNFPTRSAYTWVNKAHTVGCRLDRFYVPQSWETQVSDVTVKPFAYSDHQLIRMTFTVGKHNPRGKGIWKFNTSLLKSEDFCEEAVDFLRHWRTQKASYSDLRVWWDAGKLLIKQLAISHSVRLAKDRRSKVAALEKEYDQLLNSVDSNDSARQIRLLKTKEALHAAEDERLEGIKIRSKENWLEFGEKPTKYFFQLENKKQSKNAISSLRVGTSTVTTDKEILATALDFYKSLYTEEPVEEASQDWLLDQLELSLADEERGLCEGELTGAECYDALRAMETGKSPGPDGLPAEFYLRFWGHLGADLVDTLNCGYDKGELSVTQRRAVLRLLFKKDDPELLKNWRPISLLNVDYKTATKVLANRLRKVISRVVSTDQTCGIPDRSIYENLFLVRDAVDYAREKNIPLALISLDQEKAFDRVNRRFLRRILEKMNFGPDFRRWIDVIYTGTQSAVINNGWLSEYFTLTRGVRQGCPLSPLLYCLVAETLGQALRTDRHLKGIQIPGSSGRESRVSQYADDTTLLLRNDFSIDRAFGIIENFERGSGSRLNPDKTEGVWVGSSAGRDTGPQSAKMTWRSDRVKILGLFFGNGKLDKANWSERVSKLEKRLNYWKSRTLSLKGKAMIVNTLGASGLWYTSTVLSMPSWVHTRVSQAIWDFVWSGKTELVKRETCMLPCDQGGLQVVNPAEKAKALKLRWVPNLGDPEYQANWAYFGRYWLGLPIGKLMPDWGFLRDNSRPKYFGDNRPRIYKKVLTDTHRVGADLPQLPDFSVKSFYHYLISSTRRLPCETAWASELGIRLTWSDLWPRIYGGLNHNKECDVAWKIAHRVLPTRVYLHSWKRLRVGECCSRCKAPETVAHIFLDCAHAPSVWGWVSRWISKFSSIKLEPSTILLGHGLSWSQRDRHISSLILYLVRITINALWHARNVATFERKQLSYTELTTRITQTIRTRIRAAYTHHTAQQFNQSWAIQDALCRISEQSLVIHI